MLAVKKKEFVFPFRRELLLMIAEILNQPTAGTFKGEDLYSRRSLEQLWGVNSASRIDKYLFIPFRKLFLRLQTGV